MQSPVHEAVTNHYGVTVMAARISGAKEILLTRNANQLLYIERENLSAVAALG